MQIYILYGISILFGLVIIVSYRAVITQGLVSYEDNLSKDKTNILKGIATIGIFLSHIATHMSLGMDNICLLNKVLLIFMMSIGDIGVAVFLFLSGYGNYYSLNNLCFENSLSGINRWFIKRIKRILLSFVVVYILDYLVATLLFDYSLSIGVFLKGLFSLTMPCTLTWYIKIQLLMYVCMCTF